jgi:hypothetical protein
MRASLTNNIFYFDRNDPAAFNIVQGCSYSCGLEYSKFLNFQGNLYWRTDGGLAADGKAFHIITKPDGTRQCTGRPSDWTYLSFSRWQSKEQPVPWGPPGGMNLDTTGTASVDPKFGHTGKPTDFLLQKSPIAGFDHTKTNDTIRNAGRIKRAIKVPAVPATFPTHSYHGTEYYLFRIFRIPYLFNHHERRVASEIWTVADR